MSADSRQILVSNLPSDLTDEALILWFESQRYCPAGGDVETVAHTPSDGTAIVTFVELAVARQLILAENVAYFDHPLCISPYPSPAAAALPAVSTSAVPTTAMPTPVLQPLSSSQSSWRTSCDYEALCENIETFYEHRCMTTFRGSPVEMNTVDDVEADGEIVDSFSGDSCMTSLTTRRGSPVELNTVDDIQADKEIVDLFSADVEEPLIVASSPEAENRLYDDFRARNFYQYENNVTDTTKNNEEVVQLGRTWSEKAFRTPVLHERPLGASASYMSLPVDIQTEEVLLQFPAERLKLLDRLLSEKRIVCDSRYQIDKENGSLKLFGTKQQIERSTLAVYGQLAVSEIGSLDLPKGCMKFVLSRAGEKLLSDSLKQNGLVAVFFSSSKSSTSTVSVLAENEDVLTKAKALVEKILSSATIPFEKHHEKFLKSKLWMEAVETLESDSLLLISTDYGKLKIFFDGASDRVKYASASCSELLARNSVVSRRIALDLGVGRVLKHHRVEIEKNIAGLFDADQQSKATVPVDFDDENFLTISGCPDDVKKAETLVDSKYIQAICRDSLEIDQPGVRLEEFTTSENQGEIAIAYLQLNHRCSIVVRLKDGKRLATESVASASTRASATRHIPAPPPVRSAPTPAQTVTQSAVTVVKGNLPLFKADVVVNLIASTKSTDLSGAGAVSKAFLDAAGLELQEAVESCWPTEFGDDVVPTRSYGNVQAKRIYHAAIRKCRDARSYENLQRMISKCLKMAESEGMTSVAFPTAGCGNLCYDPSQVAQCFVRAQLQITSLKMYIVAYDTGLYDTFRLCIASPDFYSKPRPRASLSATRRSQIEVESGSLPEFQADVLVNLIASKTQNLAKAGAVASCFLRVGGAQLQKDFASQQLPVEFGTDIAITRAYRPLQCQRVYHAAIRRCQDPRSLIYLHKMICKCLTMAAAEQMSSIAFPTVGCGRLGYDPADVADCFVRAAADTGTNLKVSIVAYEDDLRDTFVDCIARGVKRSSSHAEFQPRGPNPDFEEQVDSAPGDGDSVPWWQQVKKYVGLGNRKPQMETPCSTFVFTICALENAAIQTVKEKLIEQVKKLVDMDVIKSGAIERLDKHTLAKIRDLESVDVSIEIEKKNRKITLRGNKSLIAKCKSDILDLLKVHKKPDRVDAEQVKRDQGPKAYLQYIGSQEGIIYPSYWSSAKNDKQLSMTLDSKRTPLDKKSSVYKMVEKLVMDTWEKEKVGQGQDAVSLHHSRIDVRAVYAVESPVVYRKYYGRKKEMCLNAAVNRIPDISGLQGERDIRTNKGVGKESGLVHEINECFLFHGTKQGIIDTIAREGLDNRVTGDNAMFGTGIYFAESSTKADQYADDKAQRSPPNRPLYMYVVRTILGNAYIGKQPASFKKPPCTRHPPCPAVCTSGHTPFDSVIGTHKNASTRLIFREFIVYDSAQTYPEFLVEYVRQ